MTATARGYFDTSGITTQLGKQEGYHFAQSVDGAFVAQIDEPEEGCVTLTWRPNEFPGKGGEWVIPRSLFDVILNSIDSERIAQAAAQKRKAGSPGT